MGIKYGFAHITSQSVIGLVMLVTASTTAMGTTEQLGSNGYQFPAATPSQQQSAVAEERRAVLRQPRCTPGFVCNAPTNDSGPVSRRQALQFALLIGTGTSR